CARWNWDGYFDYW
nr:immunoglobulin heavy chain junction region [Mus musculus]MBK4196476.1 immunoglobulin heavy chain junction region [Mus musculus]